MNHQTPYAEMRPKPWGFERVYTPETLPYTGKILHVNAGCRLSLQQHDQKLETMMLLSGKALLWIGDSVETLKKVEMLQFEGYTVNLMQVHRIEAVEESEILEASTPEMGTTFRLQDDYARTNEKR